MYIIGVVMTLTIAIRYSSPILYPCMPAMYIFSMRSLKASDS